MATLTPTCLQDLTTIAIPRHARWDPLGLMTVRSHVRESLASIGPVEAVSYTHLTLPTICSV